LLGYYLFVEKMSKSSPGAETPEKAAEYFRLTLAKLGELKWPVTAINYSLIYYYFSGESFALNEELDSLIARKTPLTSDLAEKLFSQYICHGSEAANEDLHAKMINTLTSVLGSFVDLSGRTVQSNSSLQRHLEKLKAASEPTEVFEIASEIVRETSTFINATQTFEESLRETTFEIDQLKDELDKVRQQAFNDPLTGLMNRRGFDISIEESINNARENDSPMCLLLIDIDHFKNVNDTHGHLVGDKVLRGLSKLLVNQMRGNDFLSRYGGEEFAVILPSTPITGAHTVAENLRKSAQKLRLTHVKTGNKLTDITISTGVACYRNGETTDDFISRCDKALYRAKNLGRNKTIVAE
jgi:diguanylate cyclase